MRRKLSHRILLEVIAELEAQERTVRWLAIKLGMEPSRVWRILYRERPMPADFPARVAAVLGKLEADLFPKVA